MASFAELKAKRGSKNGAIHSTSAAAGISASTSSTTSSTTSSDNTSMQIETLATSLMDFKPGQSSNSDTIPNSIYKLNTDLLEIRETVNAGRGLFAKKRISAGTVLIQRTPHVAILDKEHLSILCSNCMRDRGRPLKRCSGCAAVWYCSVECQKAHWKPLLHKLECGKLRQWANEAGKAGLSAGRRIPDTPIRAIGNMLLLKPQMPKDWWEEIDAMAGSPRPLTPAEQEQQGSLAVAITHYIGYTQSNRNLLPARTSETPDEGNGEIEQEEENQSALVTIFPEFSKDTFKMTKKLLEIIDKFSINSFSLTEIDLTNLGVSISPLIALINHSCTPNVSVVFPNGPKNDMKVIAFDTIQSGEELLSSYLDLTMPIQKRQQELLEQYKFECCCPECEKGKSGNEKRRSVECAKNGCSGYIPLPGRAEMIGNKELQCIQCKTSRRVRLGESEEKEGQSVKDNYKSHGIAWLMDQADDLLPRLSKQSPDHSSDFANMSLAEPKMDTTTLLKVCLGLCKEHHLTTYSYPYLALNRHLLESILISATAGPGSTTNYREARILSRKVMIGLERIYSKGHPVRAIQQVMLARLLSIGENKGEELTDIPNLRIAYEQLKLAYFEAKIGFGEDADIVKDTERGLRGLERDIAWRETASRSLRR